MLSDATTAPGRVVIIGQQRTELPRTFAGAGWNVSPHDRVPRALRPNRQSNPDVLVVAPSLCGVRSCTAAWRSRLAGFMGPLMLGLDGPDDVSGIDYRRAGVDEVFLLSTDSAEIVLRARSARSHGTSWTPRVRVGALEVDCSSPRAAIRFNGVHVLLNPEETAMLAYVAFNREARWRELARVALWQQPDPSIAEAWMRSAVRALCLLGVDGDAFQFFRGVGCRMNPDMPRQYMR